MTTNPTKPLLLLLVLAASLIHAFHQPSHRHVTTTTTHLFQSTSSSSSSTEKNTVVFSKVVRPAPNAKAHFLPQLVEYLQDKFALPPNLPMVYEQDDDEQLDAVVAWSSPLSSFPQESRLSVEVVPIQTDDTDDVSMAMVAVHKDTSTAGAVVMANLFQASQDLIIKSLDRGLDSFSLGKIKGLSSSGTVGDGGEETMMTNEWETMSREELEEVQDVEEQIVSVVPPPKEQEIIDVDIISADEEEDTNDEATTPPSEEETITNEAAVVESTISEPSTPVVPKVGAPNQEFAVAAAAAAAAKKKQGGGGGGDFAVQAAKRLAKNDGAKLIQERIQETIEENERQERKVKEHQRVRGEKKEKKKPEISEAQRKVSGPSWSISTPKRRVEQLKTKAPKKKNAPKKKVKPAGQGFAVKQDVKPKKEPTKKVKPTRAVEVSEVIQEVKEPTESSSSFVDAEIVTPEKNDESTKKRKLNLKTVDDTNIDAATPLSGASVDLEERPDDSEELKRAKEAQRLMEDISEQQGREMTAEDLLKDVLKFDEEQKEKDAQGFVTGAFEKAKEVLRERKQQRETQLKEVEKVKFELEEPPLEIPKELSAEEELKRLFQAGEAVAQRRGEMVDDTIKEKRTLTTEQEQEVDDLLSKDKTISSHARTLDEELAELEVRINRNPAEDMDGPPKNPMFDVMSGPEVYNPNVDPESAVNWPGALPGTKEVRLPKELDEAVTQAKFAANVILKMKEEVVELEDGEETIEYHFGDRILSHEEVLNLKTVVHEGVKLGLIFDPVEYMAEQSRLQIIIDELWQQPEERFREVAENYKDLLLSDNLVNLLQERLTNMADRDAELARKGDKDLQQQAEQNHAREREILSQVVVYAQLLVKEARALGAQLEAQQLELIRSICKVAMDPKHTTEEDTAAALTDAVRDMRPMFDDSFVAYLKYAVAEERGRLARAGVLDDPNRNTWYMVLTIVQQGVYAEIAKGINRYIEHIWYVMRMETRSERRNLLAEFIDVMPTLDVRPFLQVVDNIASSLGDAAKGDMVDTESTMALGEMTNKILQMHRDVHDLLPPDRVNEMAKDADEWAAKQKQRLLEQRNLTQKRLEESRETEHLDENIRRRAGEVERFD